jgi:hypothetical protein
MRTPSGAWTIVATDEDANWVVIEAQPDGSNAVMLMDTEGEVT